MNTDDLSIDTQDSNQIARQHYENFPVASIALPKRMRHPVALIYNFARQADDIADEGHYKPEHRLAMLEGYKKQLDIISANEESNSAFFIEFGQMIRQEGLPLEPFYDLLSAFSQDITKTDYRNFDEVLDYCERSANPIGILLLHLFNKVSPESLAYSNNVCTALQLINFYQDVAIDFDSTYHKKRIYLCQDEMEQFQVTEAQIASQHVNLHWEQFMMFNIERAEAMLKLGKPLESILPGRMGLEMRMIIGGGEQIIYKLKKVRGDIFKHRPTLKAWDWPLILLKALL